jgi:hypothetical protein
MDEHPSAPPQTGAGVDAAHEFDHEWKLYEARFEYAWKYFDFHATQRTTMFNFFVLFSGFVIDACIRLFQSQNWLTLLSVSALGTVVTLFFVFLDRRNEELVHVAEDILRALEKDVLFKGFIRTSKFKQRTWRGKMVEKEETRRLGIFVREEDDEKAKRKSKYLHGTWLPRIQYTIGAVFFFLALVSLRGVLHCCVRLAIHSLWQFLSAPFRP